MKIFPFKALRPADGLAARIACPPYDVVDEAEARRIAEGNPMCFLRVTRPEIQFPTGSVPPPAERYARARETLDRFRREGWLIRDASSSMYLYRQTQGAHEQLGVMALCSTAEYDQGVIRRHEHTRPAAEEDRTRHMEAIGAQPGPVFLAFRDRPELAERMTRDTRGASLYDVTADGVRHQIWRAPDPSVYRNAFSRIDAAYIADGHHRAAAAARVARERRVGGNDGFLAVLFPAGSLRICGYHRCVADLNGRSENGFLEEVARRFDCQPDDGTRPPLAGEALLWLPGRCFRLQWPKPSREDLAAALDASVLQDRLLAPVLGIADPRTDPRISFAGGLDGAEKVRRRVAEGGAAVGLVLAPVSFPDLMALSDEGRVMPPKSTWFEPKLRSGLLIHTLDSEASLSGGAAGS